MKRLIALSLLIAGAAIADPVALNLKATGRTELIIPKAISYDANADALTIHATYTLRSGVPVIETTLSGITTTITPKSNPTFDLIITLPKAAFAALYTGDTDGLVAALQAAGEIKPNAALTALIQSVAAQVIAAGE